MDAEEVRSLLRASVKEAGGNKRWLYKHKLDVAESHFNNMLTGQRPISSRKVLEAMGLTKCVTYHKIVDPCSQ